MSVKISKEEPFVYKFCRLVFKVGEWEKGIVIAYDNTVYCFNDLTKRPDIYAHEQVHFDQQAVIGVKMWWLLYLISPSFRLKQEVPAYRAQIAYTRRYYSDGLSRQLIRNFCKDIVSLYGSMVASEEEAYNLIT